MNQEQDKLRASITVFESQLFTLFGDENEAARQALRAQIENLRGQLQGSAAFDLEKMSGYNLSSIDNLQNRLALTEVTPNQLSDFKAVKDFIDESIIRKKDIDIEGKVPKDEILKQLAEQAKKRPNAPGEAIWSDQMMVAIGDPNRVLLSEDLLSGKVKISDEKPICVLLTGSVDITKKNKGQPIDNHYIGMKKEGNNLVIFDSNGIHDKFSNRWEQMLAIAKKMGFEDRVLVQGIKNGERVPYSQLDKAFSGQYDRDLKGRDTNDCGAYVFGWIKQGGNKVSHMRTDADMLNLRAEIAESIDRKEDANLLRTFAKQQQDADLIKQQDAALLKQFAADNKMSDKEFTTQITAEISENIKEAARIVGEPVRGVREGKQQGLKAASSVAIKRGEEGFVRG